MDVQIQDNLEEYVNDENKIVTYRWLSLTHNINANSAKQALYTFVVTQRNKGSNDDINVTYFVAGLSKTKQGQPIHKCVVVPESHLDIVKSEFQPVTSCHVYSVQKCKLKDITALHQTDYDIIRDNLTVSPSLSSIVCPWAFKHDSKAKPSPKASDQQPPITVKDVKNETKSSSPTKKMDSTTVKSSNGATKKKVENKGSIASMFASAGKKKDEKNATNEKPKATEQKGGVQSFFATKMSEKTSNKSTEDYKNNEEQSKKKTEDMKDEKQSKKKTEDKKDEKQSKKKSVDKKDEKQSKKKSEEYNDIPKKSRRRIKRAGLFDSSSEDEEEEAEEAFENQESSSEELKSSPVLKVKEKEVPDSIPKLDRGRKIDKIGEPVSKKKKDVSVGVNSSETQKVTKMKEELEVKEERNACEVIKENSGEVVSRKRKRTRKLVPKHTVDEDGFMVTEKVWESDSTDASDIEEVKQTHEKKTDSAKPIIKGDTKQKVPKKSVAQPTKGKQQSSLMSFFKKS